MYKGRWGVAGSISHLQQEAVLEVSDALTELPLKDFHAALQESLLPFTHSSQFLQGSLRMCLRAHNFCICNSPAISSTLSSCRNPFHQRCRRSMGRWYMLLSEGPCIYTSSKGTTVKKDEEIVKRAFLPLSKNALEVSLQALLVYIYAKAARHSFQRGQGSVCSQ